MTWHGKQTAKVYRGPKVCDMCGGPFGIHRNLNTMNGDYYCCTCVDRWCFYVDAVFRGDKFRRNVWMPDRPAHRKMPIYGRVPIWFYMDTRGSGLRLRESQRLARQSVRGSARQQEKRRWRKEIADMEYSKESS